MLSRDEIQAWLKTEDSEKLQELWAEADAVRSRNVGGEVHLRGLVEISNYCVRSCGYCGLRGPNKSIKRYRLTAEEILDCAKQAADFGYGTLVMQAGEDPGIDAAWLADIIRQIKDDTDLAVTLSLGERPGDLPLWRQAGADRYLLRFETSNPDLYERIHPSLPGVKSDRFAILKILRDLDYEVGSGVMVGIPGQTYADLLDDIERFRQLDLDMIGLGPYIAHPDTPLGSTEPVSADDQVPNSELMTYKVLALARLVCPHTNIPSTTALAALNPQAGHEKGLQRGANVVMPNLTPTKYRADYEIYPDKAYTCEAAERYHAELTKRITAIGRTIGLGRGDSPNKKLRLQI